MKSRYLLLLWLGCLGMFAAVGTVLLSCGNDDGPTGGTPVTPIDTVVQVFNDFDEWQAAVAAVADSTVIKVFNTTVPNINLAEENWGWTLGVNTHLATHLLTFTSENTGYDFQFAFWTEDIHCDYPLTFDDDEFSPMIWNSLSIGDVGNCYWDAFNISVESFRNNAQVYAVGTYVGSNVRHPSERIVVYAQGSLDMVEIEEFDHTAWPYSETPVFMGVVSNIPISKVACYEDADSDDICLVDFCFGVGYR